MFEIIIYDSFFITLFVLFYYLCIEYLKNKSISAFLFLFIKRKQYYKKQFKNIASKAAYK